MTHLVVVVVVVAAVVVVVVVVVKVVVEGRNGPSVMGTPCKRTYVEIKELKFSWFTWLTTLWSRWGGRWCSRWFELLHMEERGPVR